MLRGSPPAQLATKGRGHFTAEFRPSWAYDAEEAYGMDVTKSVTVTAGVFVRGRVFSDIRAAALAAGLRATIDREGGVARFDITGPEPTVDRFLRAVVKVCNAA